MDSPSSPLSALLLVLSSPPFPPAPPSGPLSELSQLASHRAALEARVGALLGGSRYHCAFARGIQGLLQELYDRVSEVEAEVLDDGCLTAVHVLRRLRRFSAALPPVARVARACCGARGLRGGALLQRLYEGSTDGDPLLAETFRALLWHAQQPFFSHMVAWMAYAELESAAKQDRSEYKVCR